MNTSRLEASKNLKQYPLKKFYLKNAIDLKSFVSIVEDSNQSYLNGSQNRKP